MVTDGKPSAARAVPHCERNTAATAGIESSSTRRWVLVPQPLPPPGGQPTIAGIPCAKHARRSVFISGILPDITGTKGLP
jgi:hypothetical protein